MLLTLMRSGMMILESSASSSLMRSLSLPEVMRGAVLAKVL